MHSHHDALNLSEFKDGSSRRPLLLVGQPNVGKSVIFSILTGKYVTVSNYPGTTVEVMSGKAEDLPYFVIDSPGISSIVPRSEDELVAMRMLMDESISGVLQVGDAKNLRRTLLLTVALAESGLELALDLNMMDEAERKGYVIDFEKLSEMLGIPVAGTVAVESKGKEELKKSLKNLAKGRVRLAYEPKVEEAAKKIGSHLPKLKINKKFIALTLLAGNISVVDELLIDLPEEKRRAIKDIILETQSGFSEPLSQVIMHTRANYVEKIISEVLSQKAGASISSKILYRAGDVALHPVFGYFILAGILYLLYVFVGQFAAGTLVDFLEITIFGKYIIPPVVNLLSKIPIPLLRDFLIGDYGQITMGLTYAIAIVFPIVTAFFMVFSLLEDSGYLPRLAVLLNRSFSKMGLNGKAVVPIVLGLGCGTMATLVTRVLDTRRERIIANLLLALGIPCSAQLGVILGLFSALGTRALLFFFLLIGIQLLLVGYLASKVMPGKPSSFLTELPPYRIPRAKNVIAKTYYRSRWFIKEAVPLFLLGTAILFAADVTGALEVITRVTSPVVVGILDLPARATEAFILGFLRRDYGAAGLYMLFNEGIMSRLQAFVSMIVITLFVPCIANLIVIIKERGPKVATAIISFVFVYAIVAGGIINFFLRAFGIQI